MMSSGLSIEATMRRRLLINFRVAPEALVPLLPAPFEPVSYTHLTLPTICSV